MNLTRLAKLRLRPCAADRPLALSFIRDNAKIIHFKIQILAELLAARFYVEPAQRELYVSYILSPPGSPRVNCVAFRRFLNTGKYITIIRSILQVVEV